jgi:hypothetical protein
VNSDCDVNPSSCSTLNCSADFLCVSTPIDCPGGDECNVAYCLEGVGCQTVNQSSKCDDHNPCTIDSCDPSSGCHHVDVICPPSDDVCIVTACDPTAEVSGNESACVNEPVLCVHPNNCSISLCQTNVTLIDPVTGEAYNYSGCVNTTLNCNKFYIGIIAGLAGGIIAGIVLAGAALIVAGAMAGGGAYAVSSTNSNETDHHVHNSPLYLEKKKENNVCIT